MIDGIQLCRNFQNRAGDINAIEFHKMGWEVTDGEDYTNSLKCVYPPPGHYIIALLIDVPLAKSTPLFAGEEDLISSQSHFHPP